MIKLLHPGTQVVADEDDVGTLFNTEFGRTRHHEGKYPNHGCNQCNPCEAEYMLDAVFFHVRIGL
jgi:hypothetical protein